MKGLAQIVFDNAAAVIKEYEEAVREKNTEKALRILRANPDVFGGRKWIT